MSEAFFRYARARHQITMDRAANKPRPWTSDPILSKYRFTNVFRELDRTTTWFRDNVRGPMRDDNNILLATVVFRMFNRIEVGEAIFCDDKLLDGHSAFDEFLVKKNDVSVLRKAILRRLGKKGPFVTGAYIISSPPGYTKLDGVLEVIRRFTRNSDYQHWLGNDPAGNECSLEAAWEWLRENEYFGPFHSYEIVTDLRHTRLLDHAPDIMTWANIGPGCRRGASRVLNRQWRREQSKADDAEVRSTMAKLLSLSRKPIMWPKDWPAWEMRDVEHTLCEFDKYERVRTGEGRPRGVYK